MSSRVRSKAILKAAGLAVFAAMFCVGCGDKDRGGDGEPAYYTVTLEAEGGEGVPVSVTGTHDGGNGVLVSLPTPTRDGYTFHGWYTAKGGHGSPVTTRVLCAVEAGYTKCGDATLYAHWVLAHYRITFDAHGGTVTPAHETTGDDWKLASLPVPTRAYHEFVGWYKDVVGEREKVEDTTTYKENTILYAHWIYNCETCKHYTITFDPNGGTVDPLTEETDAGGILEELPWPERDGYAFIGWFTAATGGTEVTTSTEFEEAATIYARWAEITDEMYKVTFNAHSGTVTPTFGVTGKDGKLLTPLPTPKRDGCTFQGWFAEDGEVTASTVFKDTATIHARWTIIHYTITFDATGGTVSTTTATTGQHWELDSLPTPTRDGYAFRGWFTAETGGTNVIPKSTPLIGNLTIYAHWSSNDDHFTITFDANGGEVSPASVETGDGYKLASLPVPTRDGYTFHGWFTDKTGDTHVTTLTKFESDATIYAQWTPVVHGGAVTYGDETYQTVVIGTQTWFARNLNYAVEGSKCLGEGAPVAIQTYETQYSRIVVTLSDEEVQANCEKYGRLYDWDAAMSACPTGWHLPSDAEWETLFDNVGGRLVAGWELKSASSDWGPLGNVLKVGGDDYGFSALPGGGGIMSGSELSFYGMDGTSGEWWSSTPYYAPLDTTGYWDNHAWRILASVGRDDMFRYQRPKANLSSVRCVMD